MAERDPKVPREGQDPINASGEVDEAEAAMAAGGDGTSEGTPDAELERQALDARGDLDGDGDVDRDDDALLAAETGSEAEISGGRVGAPSPAKGRGGPRFINFLRACWAELQRVQWPDRRQVGQATAVVIGFVIVAGAYLGLADAAASELVDLIL